MTTDCTCPDYLTAVSRSLAGEKDEPCPVHDQQPPSEQPVPGLNQLEDGLRRLYGAQPYDDHTPLDAA
jgi:hypothetical protein